MKIVINQSTDTIHLPEPGSGQYDSECGATYHVPAERLEVLDIEEYDRSPLSKCGRCFEGGGGY